MMVYMQKGALIRGCDEETAEKLKAYGFRKIETEAEKKGKTNGTGKDGKQ